MPHMRSLVVIHGMKTESGSVSFPTSDWLTSFLYTLMRDTAPPGVVETLVRDIETESKQATASSTTHYTNGWLAQYAKHLSDRIQVATKPEEDKEK